MESNLLETGANEKHEKEELMLEWRRTSKEVSWYPTRTKMLQRRVLSQVFVFILFSSSSLSTPFFLTLIIVLSRSTSKRDGHGDHLEELADLEKHNVNSVLDTNAGRTSEKWMQVKMSTWQPLSPCCNTRINRVHSRKPIS